MVDRMADWEAGKTGGAVFFVQKNECTPYCNTSLVTRVPRLVGTGYVLALWHS